MQPKEVSIHICLMHLMCNGCSKDDIDAHGHWRKYRTVDRYIDVNMSYPDVSKKVALAISGPINNYTLKNGTGLTDLWLKEMWYATCLYRNF